MKSERKAARNRITEVLEAVDFYGKATEPKPKKVSRLVKIASNPTHPRRQEALDELGTVVGKRRFVTAVTVGK